MRTDSFVFYDSRRVGYCSGCPARDASRDMAFIGMRTFITNQEVTSNVLRSAGGGQRQATTGLVPTSRSGVVRGELRRPHLWAGVLRFSLL